MAAESVALRWIALLGTQAMFGEPSTERGRHAASRERRDDLFATGRFCSTWVNDCSTVAFQLPEEARSPHWAGTFPTPS
jgi:hypothetical protein